jgi:hypothetical protein
MAKDEKKQAAPEENGAAGNLVITKEQWEATQATIRNLQDTLEAVADKNKLADFHDRQSRKDIAVVKLRTFDFNGEVKLVTAWKTIANEVRLEGNRWIEDQKMRVTFEDGTTAEMSLREFYQKVQPNVPAEITATTKSIGGESTYTVRLPDGKELAVGEKFVN